MNKKVLLLVCNIFILHFIFPLNLYCQIDSLITPKYGTQTLTVGSAESDIPGFTSEAIQIALDAIHTRGGGIVKLTPGKFHVSAQIRMHSNTSLIGSGSRTVLQKSDGVKTGFAIDADGGMLEAAVKNAGKFKTGMGIQIYDDDSKGCFRVTTTKIVDISGNTLYFDAHTKSTYSDDQNGTISNAFSIIEGIGVQSVTVADLTIEGNKDNNDYINGCIGGGIYFYKSGNCLIERVKVNEFNGDSFSWQITKNITVRGCEASYGNGLGFHPGTGSYRTIIENCVSHHNAEDGIFLCWRVQNGQFRNNKIYANGQYGISIGHRDTDNFFKNNHLYENGQHGVFFRNETEQNGGHRNTFVNNIVENNGTARESCGFYIGGVTHDITIENNIIRSTGKGNQAAALFLGKNSSKIKFNNNEVSGCKETVRE